jgi:hypothetical protein
VSIDGETATTGDGFSDTPAVQQTLFSRTDLNATVEHDVVLTNMGSGDRSFLDLDNIVITLGDGDNTYVVRYHL